MTTYTTLNKILKYRPCGQETNGDSGFSKLLKYLNKTEADDEPLSFITILESNGISDAIWCLRTLPDYDLKVLEFKLKSVRRVEHLDDSGKVKVRLDVLARFIDGNATKDELKAASVAYAADASVAASVAAAAAAVAADPFEREYQTQIFREIFG